MSDTFAPISPRRPSLPEPVKQPFADSRAFELKVNIIFYIVVTLGGSFLLGIDPMALFVSLTYTSLIVALVFGIVCWQHSEGILFIYFKRRPYDIGDWIEFNPTESSVSLDARRTWRVERVTLFDTDVVNLFHEAPVTWFNQRLVNTRMINWSRRPTLFQIILQVPVDAHDGDLLQNFREKIDHYANDNPSEWFAVDTSDHKATVVGNEYKEYCIEIQHRQSWHELGLVMRSKAELIRYCHFFVGELNNQKPAKRHGSALPTAFGCNDEDGGDKTDNKENDTEIDQNNTTDGVNIGNTLEEGEQEEVDGEEDENDNDGGHRMNYRIFVR